MTPFRLTAPCKNYLWGGSKLREYGKCSDEEIIAESWELSCHPDGESIIADGEYAGRTLTEFLADHPDALGEHGYRFDRFPMLVKLIDAREDLSVQVHPDDTYALMHEREYGKTEMWYIVEAQPGAELIYGFKEELTQEEFRRAIEENTLLDKVNRVPTTPGDVFFIEAGTLHAIGKGLLIAEIQQNSNTTYRVYDYGRVGADGKPRELHIEKALDVTTLAPPRLAYGKPSGRSQHARWRLPLPQQLGKCYYFASDLIRIEDKLNIQQTMTSFWHMLVLDGEATLRTESEEIPLRKGTSLFCPASTNLYKITGSCTVINTYIPRRNTL